MASSSAEVIIVPRNFVLLGELEKAEKGNTDMSISYGLVTADDITLTDWQCTILGPQNCGVEGRIISLLIRCPPKYPIEMPHIQFQSKINYPWLEADGKFKKDKAAHPLLKNWPGKHGGASGAGSLEGVLVALRSMMQAREHAKNPQPPEGQTYS